MNCAKYSAQVGNTGGVDSSSSLPEVPTTAPVTDGSEATSPPTTGSQPAISGPTDGLVASDYCSLTPTGKIVDANPTNYRSLSGTLKPGDILQLEAGIYGNFVISNLNGSEQNCIIIQGPSSGGPAVFRGNSSNNTIEIKNSSYIVIKNIKLDSLGLPGVFGVSANGLNNLVHHIVVEKNIFVNQHGSQQTVGISTKVPTWNWIIRNNRIVGAGTGLYLGSPDGSNPFIAGLIEGNLIQNTIGYNMQIKHQGPRPLIQGLPTTTASTIIRNNVFIKNDQASPDGDRPNLVVGGFPSSGPGSMDMYEIYGNFFYHNPRETLFQGSGRIVFHDNILVDGQYAAAVFQDHVLPLQVAYVFNNTVYSSQKGFHFGSTVTSADHMVMANLVFAATPLSGPVRHQKNNILRMFSEAVQYVKNPSFVLGTMDFYPLLGKAEIPDLDFSSVVGSADVDIDFNGLQKSLQKPFAGAYSQGGVNPGWSLQADLKQ